MRVEVLFFRTHVAERELGKVVVVHRVPRPGEHEDVRVHGLAAGAQLRAVLQVEHLPAHQNRLLGVARGLHGADDGVRLDGDVVVHVQDERRVRTVQRLVHDARIAAGAAQVALAEDLQFPAKVLLGFGEVRLIRRVLVALVRHEHIANRRLHVRVFRQRVQRVDRVAGAVERGDAHGHLFRLRGDHGAVVKHLLLGLLRGAPRGVRDARVVLGGDVEPQPAAVLKVAELQRDFGVAGGLAAFHRNADAVVLGAVDGDGRAALDLHGQHHRIQLRPAAPVARREGVEVRLKAGLVTRGDLEARAFRPAQALRVLLLLDQVQHAHVVRLALLGHEDALQRVHGQGLARLHSSHFLLWAIRVQA